MLTKTLLFIFCAGVFTASSFARTTPELNNLELTADKPQSLPFNQLPFPGYKIQIDVTFDDFNFINEKETNLANINPIFNTHNPDLHIPSPVSFNSILNFDQTVQDAIFLGALFSLARPCSIDTNDKIQQHISTQLSGNLYENSDLHKFSFVLKKYNQSYQQNFLKFTEAPAQEQQFSCLMGKAYWKAFSQTPALATTSLGIPSMQALTFSSALIAGKTTSCSIQKKDKDLSQNDDLIEQKNLVEQNTLILTIASLNAKSIFDVNEVQKTWLQGFEKGLHIQSPAQNTDTSKTVSLLNESKDLQQLKNINVLSCNDATTISKAIYSALVERQKILLQKIETLKKQRIETLGIIS